jgi:hypothetical protein
MSDITKRRVTMKNAQLLPNGVLAERTVTDYVLPEHLDVYVADARTRWQFVEVSEEPDAGPAGYEGDTSLPPHLVGKTVEDFAKYGDASTPENALDEHLKEVSR